LYSNFLQIFPTSRAIRAKKQEVAVADLLLPKMITIADFESRAVVVDGRFVDNMQRALFLKEASDFSQFKQLKVDSNLLKFYSQADDFFKFFQELAYEGVEVFELLYADSYAEFDKDLEVLETLLRRYREVLRDNSFTDKIFLPKEYRVNIDYLTSYDGFYLELDGFLTNYELELFEKISKIAPFIIKIRTNDFNKKMQDSFLKLGIKLENNSEIEFNLSDKKIIKQSKKELNIKSEVIKCSEHLEQIAIAFAKIEQMVQNGIDPSSIALVVPDETIAEVIKSFDRLNNFNLAMGISFKSHYSYILLKEIQEYLKGNSRALEFLKRAQFNIELLNETKNSISIDEFFELLNSLKVPLFSGDSINKELDSLNLLQTIFKFKKVFANYSFAFKDWLFLLLSTISNHTLDDIGGGKVTVLGVLETRGSCFDGVVILDFNEGVVPSISNKDRFLNSTVRANAKLPTKSDRENLQKNYYATLLENAKESAIIYQENSDVVASKFLDELKLKSAKEYITPINIFYSSDSRYNNIAHLKDEVVEFNASSYVWSNSKLKTFLECRRKFYYRYYKKLQESQSEEINDGIVLHNVLSKVLKKGNYSSVDSLKKSFLIELENQKQNLEMLYKKPLWSAMLDNFFKEQIEHFNSGWQVLFSELDIKGEINGLKFQGRVDRVDKKDEQFLVIDYKSGSTKAINSKNSENLVDFQMNIYDKLMQKPNSKIDFAYIEILNSGKLEFLKAKEEKEQKLLEHIEYLKTLKNYEATRCENLQLCRNCPYPYRLLCHRGEYL